MSDLYRALEAAARAEDPDDFAALAYQALVNERARRRAEERGRRGE